MKKWLMRIAVALLALAALGIAGIYAGSELRLAKTYDRALTSFDAKRFTFAPGEAERRARTMMCLGCHGESGKVLFEADGVGRLIAPNLSRLVPTYSDAELERLLRHGIKKDGTAVMVMPSFNYAKLADDDIAAIITFMRSRPEKPDSLPNRTTFGPLGRLALATGQLPFDADRIGDTKPLATRPAAIAPYLLDATCLHCHAMNDERDEGFMKVPPLKPMVEAYSFAEFNQMLDTGRGKGDRDIGLMGELARDEFRHFDAAERKALYDHILKAGD